MSSCDKNDIVVANVNSVYSTVNNFICISVDMIYNRRSISGTSSWY